MATLSPSDVAKILCDLLNKNYKELNGEFYIQLTQNEQHTIVVSDANGFIVVSNFIPNISKAYLEYLSGFLTEYPEIRSSFENGEPVLIVDRNSDPERVRSAFRRLYEIFAYDKPKEALNLLGGFIVRFLGQKYSVVSDKKKARGLFSENYVSLPDERGWIVSCLGADNINFPILSWKYDGSVLAYVPDPDGSLRIFNVTEFLAKLRELLRRAGISLKVSDEAELFQLLSEIEESVEIIETTLKGKTMPFVSPAKPESQPEMGKLLEEVKGGLDLLKKTVTLSRLIEQRIMTRKAIQLARRILKGEEGVISITTRKISKLGAGYAVYISKEEAKTLRLSDRVTVKVVVEEGQRPKIVIQ